MTPTAVAWRVPSPIRRLLPWNFSPVHSTKRSCSKLPRPTRQEQSIGGHQRNLGRSRVNRRDWPAPASSGGSGERLAAEPHALLSAFRKVKPGTGGEMQELPTGKLHFAPPFRFTSFDHLVGAGERRRRLVEAERLGGDQVNDEIELGRLLDWQVAAAHDFVDIITGAPEQVLQTPALAVRQRRTRSVMQRVSLWPIAPSVPLGVRPRPP